MICRNRFKNIFHSIFAKLLLVILVSGMLINLTMGGFIHHIFQKMVGTPFQKNIVQYVEYLVTDLGDPPSLEKAVEISKKASLKIHYQSPDYSWSTENKQPNLNLMHLTLWQKNPDIKIGEVHDRHIVIVTRDSGRLLFEFSRSKRWVKEGRRLGLMILLTCTLILILAYFLLRRILCPIRSLNTGVKEVSAGNLEHRVPEEGADELMDLASSFNKMTQEISRMLKAKEQLLLDVSHELRSPLTRLKLATEMLEESESKKDIKEDLSEMDNLVTEILDTARLNNAYGGLNLLACDPKKLLEEIRPVFEKVPPGLKISLLPEDIKIEVDSEQFKKVLRNVIGNALKYSPKDGGPVEISLKEQEGSWVFGIKDNGPGIPQEDIPYIFEPFYRVDKSRWKRTGGYGLGLSLSKTIIEAHGGRVEIKNNPDSGTTVLLYLPKNA